MRAIEARPYLALAAQLRPASCRQMYARLVHDASDAGVLKQRWSDPVLARYQGCSSRTVAQNRQRLVAANLITATEVLAGEWLYRVLPLRVEAVVDAHEPTLFEVAP